MAPLLSNFLFSQYGLHWLEEDKPRISMRLDQPRIYSIVDQLEPTVILQDYNTLRLENLTLLIQACSNCVLRQGDDSPGFGSSKPRVSISKRKRFSTSQINDIRSSVKFLFLTLFKARKAWLRQNISSNGSGGVPGKPSNSVVAAIHILGLVCAWASSLRWEMRLSRRKSDGEFHLEVKKLEMKEVEKESKKYAKKYGLVAPGFPNLASLSPSATSLVQGTKAVEDIESCSYEKWRITEHDVRQGRWIPEGQQAFEIAETVARFWVIKLERDSGPHEDGHELLMPDSAQKTSRSTDNRSYGGHKFASKGTLETGNKIELKKRNEKKAKHHLEEWNPRAGCPSRKDCFAIENATDSAEEKTPEKVEQSVNDRQPASTVIQKGKWPAWFNRVRDRTRRR